MEFITIALVDDPSVTQQVSAKNFLKWPKAKGLDENTHRAGAGTFIWQVVDDEFVKAHKEKKTVERREPKMPVEIQRVKGNAPAEPDPVVEEATAEVVADAPKPKKK